MAFKLPLGTPFPKNKTQIVGKKDDRPSQTVGVGQGYLDQLSKDKTDYMGNLKKYQGSYIQQQPVESTMPSVNVTATKPGRKRSFAERMSEFQGGNLTGRQKRLISKGKTGKASKIAERRRKRMLKRGGEVAKTTTGGVSGVARFGSTTTQSKGGRTKYQGDGGIDFASINKGKKGGFLRRLFT